MTRTEMKKFTNQVTNIKKGYCCRYEATSKLLEIGSNSGYYGWNWTLYYEPETDTAYIDGYRNF